MRLPSGWSPSSVEQTELVAIVSEERKIDLGSQAYNIGPDITAYRFENDLELREARTGNLLSTFTFMGSTPPPFPYQASYITTSIEGTHIFAQDIENWMCDLVMSVKCIKQSATLNESGSAIHAIAFSPDGKILASGHEDAAVRLWQVSDGSLVGTLYGHTASVLSLAFSPDGQFLATGSNDQTVRIWRTSDWGLVRSLEPSCFVIGVAFSPDGQTLLAGCSWSAVQLFQVSDGSLVPGWETVGGSSFAFSPDGQFLAVGHSLDNSTALIRVSDVNQVFYLINPPDDPASYGNSNSQITELAFSPDGKLLAAASADRSVGLWRVSDGSLLQTLWGRSGYSSVAFSPDGQMLAAASFGEDVELWQVSEGRLLRTFRGPYRISAVAFSPDGHSLVSSDDYGGSIYFWQLR
jgi:WD40 repeat protein